MANYDPDRPGLTGGVPTAHAAAASDSFTNNGAVLIRVINAGGGSITVTADDPNSATPTAATAFNPDVGVAVAAGASKVIGPFPPNRFNDTNGRVQLSWSGTTSVTWEAVATV